MITTQELARRIIRAVENAQGRALEYSPDLIIGTLNEIKRFCEEQLPQVTSYEKEDTDMGGKPSKGTPADKRLAQNKPATPATPAPTTKKPATKKTTGK